MENLTAPESNLRAFSVSELSFSLKRTLEDTFTYVRVKGEISGCKVHSSGHIYFSLKDEKAVLDSVCWKGVAASLPLKPQDGLEVIASGKITAYPGRSKYQIVVQSMEVAGQGALLKLLEDRKKKLQAQGLFEASRKKPLPYLPQTIGVVTSPTGAVIRDILHRLSDRMPTHVVVWPVAVQGPQAHLDIAAAIDGFNALDARPDLLIVARGGGSLEDLWAFNEEEVVLATARSEIPIISAVGHETDTTLIDYAADYRAPTPTGAAERAVPVRADLRSGLLSSENRLMNATHRLLQDLETRVEGLRRGIPSLSQLTDDYTQRLDDWTDRFQKAFHNMLLTRTTHLNATARLLESYSHTNVLKRGFTLVKDDKGQLITHKKATQSGMNVEITFQDGRQKAIIGSTPRKRQEKKTPPSSTAQMDFWNEE